MPESIAPALPLRRWTRPEYDRLVEYGVLTTARASSADTSRALDRGEKAGLYAEAGIREYWIVDLVNGRPEVHRDPARDAGGGARYGTGLVLPR